ncbi:MAG: succinylglutamate desuccinylase/aspartoacylase family protein [Longimicrobiales bacterium]
MSYEEESSGDRILGRIRGGRPGPTLLCIGALHGNETAGVRGIEAVLERLGGRGAEMAGEFVALVGNRQALARGRRYLDRDLNRAWTTDRLGALVRSREGSAEDREQRELIAAIDGVVRSARGPVYVLDLHTTSGSGGTFSTFGDTLPNRDFAAHIPAPMILGLEELVDGTLLAFLGQRGLVAVVFESGQHDEPAAVDRAEAAIWIAVSAAGLLPQARLPEATDGWKRIHRDCRGLPRALEMRYRHDIGRGDGFRMKPGYRNFQPVAAGEVVAMDAKGEVHVREASRILMPLYQEQGDDGFFLVREFSPFWLWLSSALRRLKVDRVAHWLPGVQRLPDTPDGVVVDKRVARWYAVQLFHLLGFRKEEDAGSRVVLRRRRFDEARFVDLGPPPETLGDGPPPA